MSEPASAATTRPKDRPDLSRFDWADPFRFEQQIDEEERMIRDAAAAFAADRLAPRVEAAYLEEHTDPAIFAEMGETGLLGVTVPEEYGGAGASYVAYGLVAREVERIDSGYRSMMSGPVLARDVSRSMPMARKNSAGSYLPETRIAANGSAASASPNPTRAPTPAA